MAKLFKKDETETEEKIELTPEEKKAKVKKTVLDVCKTVGAMAAGAALTMAAIIGIGGKTVKNSEDEDELSDESIEEDASCDTLDE